MPLDLCFHAVNWHVQAYAPTRNVLTLRYAMLTMRARSFAMVVVVVAVVLIVIIIGVIILIIVNNNNSK